MVRKKTPALSGTILTEESELTLGQFCQACSIRTELVIEMVEEGILEPTGEDREHWHFRAGSIRRAGTAQSLRRALDVNMAGAALAIELLDRIETLRHKIRVLELRRSR